MKFTDLYNTCIKLWPKEIHIGDGYPSGKTGYVFPELVLIHDRIEEGISVEDGWLQIIDWSFFQAFHAESKRLIQNNEKTLNPRSVAKSEIQWRVIENLSGDGWESLRAEYINDFQET